MSKESPRYTEEFKKSVVSLYHNELFFKLWMRKK